MALEDYEKKRDFSKTPEPKGGSAKEEGGRFVVHEHHASRLHFDLRLEMNGVLKSWAVPKGPSMNPADKRLAVMVEDHPLEYITFRGEIAEGNYGAGEVEIWDSGTYIPLENELDQGKLVFELMGAKLKGTFHLVRLKGKESEWLLIKGRDGFADPDWKLQQVLPGGSRKERKGLKDESRSGGFAVPRHDHSNYNVVQGIGDAQIAPYGPDCKSARTERRGSGLSALRPLLSATICPGAQPAAPDRGPERSCPGWQPGLPGGPPCRSLQTISLRSAAL